MGTCVSCVGKLTPVRRYDFKSDLFRHVYRDRNVYDCMDCGLRQADVAKVDRSALDRYYRTQYRAVAQIGVGDSGHTWYLARATALAELAAESLSKYPVRAFEFGTGYGYNLLALKTQFPSVLLFCDELDETIPLPKEIERAELAGGNYDVVILSHVLEHFVDPRAFLNAALNALSADGVLIIEVPNDVPRIFPLNGPDEPHLLFFTLRTLTTLLGTPAVYAAGPPYQRKTLRMRARRTLSRSMAKIPILAALLAKRRAQIISPKSFSARRSDGIFLRAVMSKRPSSIEC